MFMLMISPNICIISHLKQIQHGSLLSPTIGHALSHVVHASDTFNPFNINWSYGHQYISTTMTTS